MGYDDNLDPECQIIPQICTFLSVPFGFLYKSLVAFNDYSGFSVLEVLLTLAYLGFYVCEKMNIFFHFPQMRKRYRRGGFPHISVLLYCNIIVTCSLRSNAKLQRKCCCGFLSLQNKIPRGVLSLITEFLIPFYSIVTTCNTRGKMFMVVEFLEDWYCQSQIAYLSSYSFLFFIMFSLPRLLLLLPPQSCCAVLGLCWLWP